MEYQVLYDKLAEIDDKFAEFDEVVRDERPDLLALTAGITALTELAREGIRESEKADGLETVITREGVRYRTFEGTRGDWMPTVEKARTATHA